MDGKSYATHILPLIASHLRHDMVFMQDYTSTLSSDDATREMAPLSLGPIPWPANSPDLNPIETIWFKIKQRIIVYTECPTWIQPFCDALKAESEKITIEEIQTIFDTMLE